MTNSRVINFNSHFIRLRRSNLNILNTEFLTCFPSNCSLLNSRLAFISFSLSTSFPSNLSILSLTTKIQSRTSQIPTRTIPQLPQNNPHISAESANAADSAATIFAAGVVDLSRGLWIYVNVYEKWQLTLQVIVYNNFRISTCTIHPSTPRMLCISTSPRVQYA